MTLSKNTLTPGQELEVYNDAVRRQADEAWRRDSFRGMTPALKNAFEKIIQQAENEFAAFEVGDKSLTPLTYIEFPDEFLHDVYDLAYYPGTLGPEEKAWIQNTKEALKACCIKLLQKKKAKFYEYADQLENNAIKYFNVTFPELAADIEALREARK